MTKEELAETMDYQSYHKFQCHCHQMIVIGPGGGGMGFHQDLTTPFNFGGKIEYNVTALWSLSGFTEVNGPTHVVLGSHRAQRKELRQMYKTASHRANKAVTPKGSVEI